MNFRILVDFQPVYRIKGMVGFSFGDIRATRLSYLLASWFLGNFQGTRKTEANYVVRQGIRNCDIHLFQNKLRSRSEVFYWDVKQLVLYEYLHAFGEKRGVGFRDIQVWAESNDTSSGRCDKTSSGNCDEKRKFVERWCVALSQHLYWYWPVVGMFKSVCRLYNIAVGIVLYDCASLFVERVRCKHGEWPRVDRYNSSFEGTYSSNESVDVRCSQKNLPGGIIDI